MSIEDKVYIKYALNNFQDTYVGSKINEVPNGFGIFYHENGDVEKGHWKQGKLHGVGEVSYLNIGHFIGDFENGNIIKGIFTGKNETYNGEFDINGKYSGFGVLLRNDGKKIYEGYWENGLYTKKGILFDSFERKVYEGEFEKGKYHNKGSLFNSDGILIQKGIWNNDIFIKGTVYNSNGQKIYHGEVLPKPFGSIVYHGYGQQFNSYGTLIYEGEFKHGKYHNKGLQYNRNGVLICDGEFQDGKWYGYCSLYNSNGLIAYIGYVKKGILHDNGVRFYDNGNPYYEGKYKEGVENGRGIFFSRDGKKTKEGVFKNGKLHGKGIVYESDGVTIKQSGKFIHDNYINESIFLIRKCLETNDKSFLKKVTKKSIIDYINQRFNLSVSIRLSKEQISVMLMDLYQKEQVQMTPSTNLGEEDLFGNTIETKCLGNDGEIYDLKSMNYLFQKNEKGDYINISYCYNENSERVPNYPIMTNGTRLLSFTILPNDQ